MEGKRAVQEQETEAFPSTEQGESTGSGQTGDTNEPASKLMRSLYNRIGFGSFAGLQIHSAVGSIGLTWGAIIAALVSGIYKKVLERMTSLADLENAADWLLTEAAGSGLILAALAAFVAMSVIGMGIGILVLRKIIRRSACSARIPKKSLPAGSFLIFVLLAFLLWGTGAVLGNVWMLFGLEESDILERIGTSAMPYYVYAVIGAPVLEELFFRKTLLDAAHGYGRRPAILASALLFGLAHGNSGQFFLAFLLGLLFAAIYLETGHIRYTMALHAMINLMAVLPSVLALVCPEQILLINGIFLVVYHVGITGGLICLLVRRGKDIGWMLGEENTPLQGEDSRRAFRAPGMRFYTIVQLVSLVLMDMVRMLTLVMTDGAIGMTMLIPTVLAVLLVVLLPRLLREKVLTDSPEAGFPS